MLRLAGGRGWNVLKLLSRLGGLVENALPVLVCVLAFLAGYVHGADTAEQEGKARIATLQTAWSERERARAEAAAAAEKSARERLAAEVERGNRLAAELTDTARTLDAARADLNKRIRHVSETARRDCPGLPAEWVRLYNEALGLADANRGSASEGSAPGGAGDAADAARATRAGVREDALTTPEDVLAHIRDYGHYCRRLEAGYRGLVKYAGGTP